MAPTWSIHSFHISVPVGDAAIHLLCDTTPAQGGKPEVHSAVLIDGGKPQEKGAEAIKGVIRYVNDKYAFTESFADPFAPEGAQPPFPRSLRFDSIVITHWDEDHYLGVLGLLADGFDLSFTKGKYEGSTISLGSWCNSLLEKTKKTANDWAVLIPNWYCKYDDASIKQLKDNKQQAVSCVVYNDGNSSSYDKLVEAVKKHTGDYKRLKTTIYVPGAVDAAFSGPDKSKRGITNRIKRDLGRLEYEQEAQFASFQYKVTKGAILFPYLANLKESYKLTIGTNLFTQSKPQGSSWDSFESPHDLLKSHNLGNQPGLFIVASQQRVIHNATRLEYDKYHASTPTWFALPEKTSLSPAPIPIGKTSLETRVSDGVEIGSVPNVIGENHEQIENKVKTCRPPSPGSIRRNAISIVTMALGAQNGTADFKNTEILHYSGGDALWDVEGGIARWLVDAKPSTDTNTPYRTKVMKLSHHGSKGTSSIALLNVLFADYYVASATNGGRFGHPHMEVSLMMYAQWKYQQYLDIATTELPWLSMCYPAWLNPSTIRASVVPRVRAFTSDDSKPSVTFRTAVNNRMKHIQGSESTPFTIFNEDIKKIKDLKTKGPSFLKVKPNPTKAPTQDQWDEYKGVLVKMKTFWDAMTPPENDPQKPGISFLIKTTPGQPAQVQGFRESEPPFSLMKKTVPVGLQAAPTQALNISNPKVAAVPSTISGTSLQTNMNHLRDITNIDYRMPLKKSKVITDMEEGNGYLKGDIFGDKLIAEYEDPEDEFLEDDMEKDPCVKEEVEKVTVQPEPFHEEIVTTHSMSSSSSSHQITTLPLQSNLMMNTMTTNADADALAPYLLVSSIYVQDKFAYDSSRFAFISPDTVFDIFSFYLPSGYVVLERKQPEPAASGATEVLELSMADEWGKRLMVPGRVEISSVNLTCSFQQEVGSGVPQLFVKVTTIDAKIKMGGGSLSREFAVRNISAGVDSPTTGSDPLEIRLAARHSVMFWPLVLDNIEPLSLPDLLTLLGPPWLADNPLSKIKELNDISFSFKKTDARSGLYLAGGSVAPAALRFDFELDKKEQANAISDWLRTNKIMPLQGINIEDLVFTSIKEFRTEPTGEGLVRYMSDIFQLSGKIRINSSAVDFRIRFQPDQTTVTIRFPDKGLSVAEIFSWLSSCLDLPFGASGFKEGAVQELSPTADPSSVSVAVYQVDLSLDKDMNWSCTVTLQLNILGSVFITYFSLPGPRLRAELWNEYFVDREVPSYLPWFDDWTAIVPFDADQLSGKAELKDMDASAAELSDLGFLTLRNAVFDAGISNGNNIHVELTATVAVKPPELSFPMIWPKSFRVQALYNKTIGAGSSPSWRIGLAASLYLPPKIDDIIKLPVRLDLSATKTDQYWLFAGSTRDLDFGALYGYFATDARDDILDMLGGIGIPRLDVQFLYAKQSKQLIINGLLQLKTIFLEFEYTYSNGDQAPGGADWQLTASFAGGYLHV
ncbi:hypothetical protein ONZ43_g1001 [Nemania bipapillata]|uniref:Uncharacterized protein n=1 Tax=Nemania bipapillata TaxID=110536 RepID=A0ACC2J696_9PEZI|nr:hypothetical protein ONZ43_g1001 [Nemania bipapillata]